MCSIRGSGEPVSALKFLYITSKLAACISEPPGSSEGVELLVHSAQQAPAIVVGTSDFKSE